MNSSRWLILGLALGVRANRSAIGARIRVRVATASGERDIHKTVSTGGSFGCSPLRAEIGLGQARAIQSLEIRWPGSGRVQTLAGLAMDRFYQLREGDSNEVPWSLASFPWKPASAHAHHHD